MRRFPNESRPAIHFKDSFSATGNCNIDQRLGNSSVKYPTLYILGFLAHSSTFVMARIRFLKKTLLDDKVNLVTRPKSEVLGEKSYRCRSPLFIQRVLLEVSTNAESWFFQDFHQLKFVLRTEHQLPYYSQQAICKDKYVKLSDSLKTR